MFEELPSKSLQTLKSRPSSVDNPQEVANDARRRAPSAMRDAVQSDHLSDAHGAALRAVLRRDLELSHDAVAGQRWAQSLAQAIPHPGLQRRAVLGPRDCLHQARALLPTHATLHAAQAHPFGQTSANTNGSDGYRVVSRDSFAVDAAKFPHYVSQCSTFLRVVETVFTSCGALGYNVTRDMLRIVDGVDSSTVIALPGTLPVLLLPYYDMAAQMRYVIPGHEGSACVFREIGLFSSEAEKTAAFLAGVDRSVREQKTEAWLGYPGGVWRNGWYEDPVVHMRWYSDVISSIPNGKYEMPLRQFDLVNGGAEVDCSKPPYGCQGGHSTTRWNDDLYVQLQLKQYDSITISNASRFGLFQYSADYNRTILSHYNIGTLLSNLTFAVLLVRWLVTLLALSPTATIGIGALANSSSFHFLPLFLLPRLKSALTSFWTVGCRFEGPQIGLESAWFEIYPAIGEVVILYYCLLNTLAKVLRRRMSDALFGPTLLTFFLLHFLRSKLMLSGVWQVDGRMYTLVTSSELDTASVLDFFTTDLAYRVNGQVQVLFLLKLCVLGVNLLPLVLFSRRVSDESSGSKRGLPIKRALALDFASNAGMGSTQTPYTADQTAVRPYELVRCGYIVAGSVSGSGSHILVSVDHWFWLMATAPCRRIAAFMVRVVILELQSTATTAKTTGDGVRPHGTESARLEVNVCTTRELEKVSLTCISANYR